MKPLEAGRSAKQPGKARRTRWPATRTYRGSGPSRSRSERMQVSPARSRAIWSALSVAEWARRPELNGASISRRTCVQELSNDRIDQVGPGQRGHMPALRDRVESPVRAGPGEERHDFPNGKARGGVAHHERARFEALPALDGGLLVHDGVPLMKVWEQRLREGGSALLGHRAPGSVAQPVVRKAFGHLRPISQRSVALHMVPQAP